MSAVLLAPLAVNVARLAALGDAGLPEWVQITPPGPALRGRDGRSWTLPAPERVVAQFRADAAAGIAVPVDLAHATETFGGPAVGWVADLAVHDGALWARVAWNAAGRAALAERAALVERAFRFVSPAFLYDATTWSRASMPGAAWTGRVLRLRAVALTNRPNFPLPALNRAKTETPIDPEVLTALGLAPTATSADAVAAIVALREPAQTALNRAAVPDPALFVPRADYQLALNRIAARAAAGAAGLLRRDGQGGPRALHPRCSRPDRPPPGRGAPDGPGRPPAPQLTIGDIQVQAAPGMDARAHVHAAPGVDACAVAAEVCRQIEEAMRTARFARNDGVVQGWPRDRHDGARRLPLRAARRQLPAAHPPRPLPRGTAGPARPRPGPAVPGPRSSWAPTPRRSSSRA
jgi:hypothetical protein